MPALCDMANYPISDNLVYHCLPRKSEQNRTGKDNGDIIALGGSWGRTSKAQAINDIDTNTPRRFRLLLGYGCLRTPLSALQLQG